MCGITGIFSPQADPKIGSRVHQMTTSLSHRGPDDEGFAICENMGRKVHVLHGDDTNKLVTSKTDHIRAAYDRPLQFAMGHRRLSIIDLSPDGHQPMKNPSGQYWLTYNGEIYNYLELRKELESEGCVFRSHSDSEVLLVALIHWGKAAIPRLEGMFAFCFVNLRDQSAIIARDPFGIKPLYYALLVRNQGAFEGP